MATILPIAIGYRGIRLIMASLFEKEFFLKINTIISGAPWIQIHLSPVIDSKGRSCGVRREYGPNGDNERADKRGETRLSNRSVCTFFVFVFPLDDHHHHHRQTWRFYYRKIFTFSYTARPTRARVRYRVLPPPSVATHFRRRSENVGPAFAAHRRCACVYRYARASLSRRTPLRRLRRRRRRYKSNGTAAVKDDDNDDRPGKKNSQLKKKSIDYRNRSAG